MDGGNTRHNSLNGLGSGGLALKQLYYREGPQKAKRILELK